jgi:tetratricopeptide (TPR) repeat protein
MGDIADAVALAERCAAPTGPASPLRVRVTARLLRARLALDLGDHRHATAAYRALADELRADSRPYAACEALAGLAEAHAHAGRLAAAIEAASAAEALARAHALPWRSALAQIRRAEAMLACGLVDDAATLLRAHAGCGERTAPWFVRRSWLTAVTALREAEGDAPGALAAHVRAGEAGVHARDVPFEAFHTGMSGIYTANADAIAEAIERLRAVGASRALAQILLTGGRVGRDPELLDAAESEARDAGDPLLLVRILHAGRHETARDEAGDLVTACARGLHGPARDAFAARPFVRWALDDTEGRS